MRAANYNFVIQQGTTVQRRIVWRDGDGEPIDLAGYRAKMHVKKGYEAEEPILELSTSDGSLELETEDKGEIWIQIEPTQTWDLEPDNYIYDLLLISADDMYYRLLEGEFLIKPAVTAV